ncbi:MAG: hypothetical protein WCL39_15755, partial [Armatimonadota bacterium]
MELWKYYRKLYRRKWLIIVGMIVCVGVAGTLAWREREKFTFGSSVMERTSTGANILSASSYSPIDPEIRLNNLAQIASSTKVYEALVDANVSLDAAAYWREHVSIVPDRESMLLRISVWDYDRDNAQLAVDTITKQFSLEYQSVIYGREEQRKYIQDELAKSRLKLEQAREALARYKEENNVSDINAEVQTSISRTGEMESQWRSAQVSSREADNRLKTVDREFKKLPVTRKEGTQLGENQLWLSYTQQLTSREQELASMMVSRGPAHPEVKALQKSIDDIKSQLVNEQRQRIVSTTEAVNPVYTQTLGSLLQARVESIGNRARVQALGTVVPQMKAELAAYPRQEQALTDLMFEAKVAESTYGLLRQKLDEAKLQESDKYAAGSIQVVDEPRQMPTVTNKKLKVVLALPLIILLYCML